LRPSPPCSSSQANRRLRFSPWLSRCSLCSQRARTARSGLAGCSRAHGAWPCGGRLVADLGPLALPGALRPVCVDLAGHPDRSAGPPCRVCWAIARVYQAKWASDQTLLILQWWFVTALWWTSCWARKAGLPPSWVWHPYALLVLVLFVIALLRRRRVGRPVRLLLLRTFGAPAPRRHRTRWTGRCPRSVRQVVPGRRGAERSLH
jgi:hypothetical protein